MTCNFGMAWIGPCKTQVTATGEHGEKHAGRVCASCGAPAESECDETMGPLVCGAPLCPECEHTTYPNGCNSGATLPKGMAPHCKKSEQVFVPWYETDADEKNMATLARLKEDPSC